MKLLLATLVLMATALAACGGEDNDVSRSSKASPVTVPAMGLLEAGEAADFPNGLRVIVQGTKDIDRPERSEPLRWVEVSLRIENPSDGPVARPNVAVTCANGSGGAFYVTSEAGDRTLEKLTEVPAKSFAEGATLFGMPKPCPDARVKVSATGALLAGFPAPAYWRLP